MAADQVREQREMDERRRAAAGAVGAGGAVADDVESQFAVGRFRGGINFFVRRLEAAVGHHHFEMRDQAFDRGKYDAFVGQNRPAAGTHVHRPGGQVFERLPHDLHAFAHFGHPHHVPRQTIAFRRAANVEIEILVGQVRLVLAQIARDAAGPGDRPAATAVDGLFFRQHAHAFRAADENPVAVQQVLHVVERLGDLDEKIADHLDRLGRNVVHQPADAGVAVREPRAAHRLEDVVERLAGIEGVNEVGERAGVEARRPVAQEMVGNPRQLGDKHANVLAARRHFDAHQLFDRLVPGHVVGHRRNVVHAVGDRHVLIVIQLLAELFEARVQITDVRHGVDHGLAYELQHQPQRRVRGRMLRTEIQRPHVRLRLVVRKVAGRKGGSQGHEREVGSRKDECMSAKCEVQST